MKTNEIRKLFLDYFREHDHRVIDPSPLPVDDPTLLFTVAGMVPLKQYYLGESVPASLRMASCQPCLRTNDIENVGKTPRHHTFFEMLGNFSIGDYFKREAIEYGWDFITNILHIQANRLFITIYPEDTESRDIWKKYLPSTHIVESKDNFWQMGPVGPCGYDSEIFVDLGSEVGCGRKNCGPLCECGRFLEVWNLVFMEFTLEENGSRSSLPRKNIDTGMGLERISCVLNNVQSNYDTDLFIPIIESLEKLTHQSRELNRFRYNIIADHVRAISFLIADGVFPENTKHGYVLRRLIRRAKLSGHLLGIRDSFLVPLCEQVVKESSDYYKKISINLEKIKLVVKNEEEQFSNTLEEGYKLFQRAIQNVSAVFPGDIAFKLHDTYGFPIELTKELLLENNLSLNQVQFDTLLQEQKNRAKISYSFSNTLAETDFWVDLKATIGSSVFLGYERDSSSATIRAILKDENRVDKAVEINEKYLVITDQTPLYPEKGGPLGDQGTIRTDQGLLRIVRTFAPIDGIIVHEAQLEKGEVSLGEVVQITVDIDFRRGIRRAHTATHLLHAALKKVVGEYVNQAGSFVEPDSLRFDFNAFEQLTSEQIIAIEDTVNDWIARSDYVCTNEKTLQQAIDDGAAALFKEKYGDSVRVVQICDISTELCGGLHVNNTSELRVFGILKESSVGSNLRRIEAIVGNKAIELFREDAQKIKEAKIHLEKPSMEIIDAIDTLIEDRNGKEKEIRSLRSQIMQYTLDNVLKTGESIGKYRFIFHTMKNANMDMLRDFSDQVRSRIEEPIVVFVTSSPEGKTMGVLSSSGEMNCRKLLATLQDTYLLRGGGNDKMVSLGSMEADKIAAIADRIRKELSL